MPNIHNCCTAYLPVTYEQAKEKAQQSANATGQSYIVTIFNTVIIGDEKDEYTKDIFLPQSK